VTVRKTARRTPVALLAAAALLLTGCAGLRPGVAAEVGSDKITTHDLDTFAKSLCAFYSGSGQSATSASARNDALTTMVLSRLVEQNATPAATAGIDQSQVDQTVQQVDSQAKLSGGERDDFLAEVRKAVTASALLQQLVSSSLQASGQQATQQNAQAESTKLIDQWTHRSGVEVDPRFGSWTKGRIEAASGSLSVPASSSSGSAGASRACP
jgi:hypothetical protein